MKFEIDRQALEVLVRNIDLPIADLRLDVSRDGKRVDADAELHGFTRGQLIRKWVEDVYGVVGEEQE